MCNNFFIYIKKMSAHLTKMTGGHFYFSTIRELLDAVHAANRSTVFTGLKVLKGTSTNTVFQSLIEPFHKPGNSSAFKSFHSLTCKK